MLPIGMHFELVKNAVPIADESPDGKIKSIVVRGKVEVVCNRTQKDMVTVGELLRCPDHDTLQGKSKTILEVM